MNVQQRGPRRRVVKSDYTRRVSDTGNVVTDYFYELACGHRVRRSKAGKEHCYCDACSEETRAP